MKYLIEFLSGKVGPLVNNIAKALIKIIDTINAPLNPWIVSEKQNEFNIWSLKGEDWFTNNFLIFKKKKN